MITFDCYNNVRAIHFPPGLSKDGGSCDFTSKKCRKECNYKINKFETECLRQFKDNPFDLIAGKISREMTRFKCNILTWFATGDCPKDLTDKIVGIMHNLNYIGRVQCGFTRNKKLWEESLLVDNMRLALSIEDEEEAEKLSERGLVGVPNYEEWTTDIYVKGNRTFNCGGGFGGSCGAGFLTIGDVPAEEIYSEDCGHCYEGNRGCFVN